MADEQLKRYQTIKAWCDFRGSGCVYRGNQSGCLKLFDSTGIFVDGADAAFQHADDLVCKPVVISQKGEAGGTGRC